jgi:excisionase family DNA binding protein
VREAEPKLWKVDEAARYLGIRPKTLYEWVRAGRVPHRKLGFNVRFDPDELRDWAAGAAGGPRRARPSGGTGMSMQSSSPEVSGAEADKTRPSEIAELCRVAREAADQLRRLETSLGAQLTFPQRRELASLADRLEVAADVGSE